MIYTQASIQSLKGRLKAVVFDFGSVLLELEPEDTFSALSNALGVSLEVADFDRSKYSFFHAFEKGEMRFETFLWNLQRLSSVDTPHARPLINAWNAMLKGWKPDKLELLQYLQGRVSTYLLSNTNELHLKWVYNDLQKSHDIVDFDGRFFNKTFYSHQLGMRKPNNDIFEYVWSCIDSPREETLFIDDNEANVHAASKLGINAVLHPRNSALDYLTELF